MVDTNDNSDMGGIVIVPCIQAATQQAKLHK